jgi:antitoxin component YwqK of YwqJK toxin-antitoxin module
LLLSALLLFVTVGLTGCGQKKEYKHECPSGTERSQTSEKVYRIVSCLDGEGRKQGKESVWHEDGQKVGDHQYRDGVKHGVFRSWHESGNTQLVSEYRDGKPNGVWTAYHENGEKAVEAHLRDGKSHGKVTEWDEQGEVRSVKHCTMGECIPAE